MTFTKENAQELGRLSGQVRRSPELKKAYAEREKIRTMYKEGTPVSQLVKIYNINKRSCYRLIGGK